MTTRPAIKHRARVLLLVLALGTVAAYVTGARAVVEFVDTSCPAGYRERPVGLVANVVVCEPTAALPADAPQVLTDRANRAAQREVGLYFANARVRAFDLDFVAGNYLWFGVDVAAPE